MKKIVSVGLGALIAIVVIMQGYAEDIVATASNQVVTASDNTSEHNIASPPITPEAALPEQPKVAENPMPQPSAENVATQPTATSTVNTENTPEVTPPVWTNEGVTPEPTIKELAARITDLEKQNAQLQLQVTQDSARLILVEKELTRIQQKNSSGLYGQSRQFLTNIEERIGPQAFLIVVSAVVIVAVLLLGYIIFPRRKNSGAANYYSDSLSSEDHTEMPKLASSNVEPSHEEQEDYAAKLNLARAYVEMGDKDKAESILHDILAHGTEAEQKEAKELISKMSTPPTVE